MLYKIALIALLGASQAKLDKTDQAIHDRILKENNINIAKADITASSPIHLLDSSKWDASAASTCQECAISKGAWDEGTKTCTAGSGSTQSISHFLSASSPCVNNHDFCLERGDSQEQPYMKKVNKKKVKEEHTFSNEPDFSWSYKVNYLKKMGGEAPTFKQWDFCSHSFDLPTKYVGGLGILAIQLPGKVETFIKIQRGDNEPEYFNGKKILQMQPGTSKSLILFDVSKVEFTYVATAASGNNMELYDFKIGFYRLNYKQINHIYSLYDTYHTEIYVGWIFVIGGSAAILFWIIKKLIDKKREGFYNTEVDVYSRI